MSQLPQQMPPRKPFPKKNTWRNFLIVILLLTAVSLIFSDGMFQEKTPREEIPLSKLQNWYRDGELKSIDIKNDEVVAVKDGEDGKHYFAVIDPTLNVSDLGFDDETINDTTEVKYISTKSSEFWTEVISRIVPFLLIIVVFFFIMRSFSKGASGAFSFGKSKDKLFLKGKKKTCFKDVAGCEEPKQELIEIVEFLKNPKKFTKMGAKIPRGVLLIGPPGTGKTLLARAVAGEADVPFFSISGSEFVEMFVGVGASRVRDLFMKAKKNSPSIIFIDEIDAVGKQRGQGLGGGHDEREQTLNQILTEMDGFDNETNVIVMAATNRPDVLDKALLRPGRFDRRVSIDLPQMSAREEILSVHARNKPLAPDVKLKDLAKITPGFSGADLENMLNEAAILAARENKDKITMAHLHNAHEKAVLGPEKRSLILSEEEKRITAYHETGHAIISHVMPKGDPVRKLTIIPRGMALGVTYSAPDEETHHKSSEDLFTDICVSMGGRAAEKMIFGDMGAGAMSDIRHATNIARAMVMKFGMSEIGPMEFDTDHIDFIGGELGGRSYSQEFAGKIDSEVQKLLLDGMKKAEELLKKHEKELHEIASALLKCEIMDQEAFESFFPGMKKPEESPPKKPSLSRKKKNPGGK